MAVAVIITFWNDTRARGLPLVAEAVDHLQRLIARAVQDLALGTVDLHLVPGRRRAAEVPFRARAAETPSNSDALYAITQIRYTVTRALPLVTFETKLLSY